MTNFPNGVASFGLPILPMSMGLPVGGGRAIWVHSGYTGGASNGDFDRPFTSLETALNSGKVRASKGDVVYIKPGHAESVASASAISLDLAGVTIIGLGMGDQRPTFTWTTANTATIAVTAADVTIANCIFSANFDSIANAFALTTATNFTMINCRIKDASAADVSFVNVIDTNTTDNAADGLTIIGCERVSEDDATGSFVDVDATIDRFSFIGNKVLQTTSTVVGLVAEVAANKQLTNVVIRDNLLHTDATDSTGGLLVTGTLATSFGEIARNRVRSLDAAGVVFLAALTTPVGMFDNWYTGAAAEPLAIATAGGTAYNDA